MARGPRDYHREYERRIELGSERGLSRSAARGHAREGELPASAFSARAIEVVPLGGGRSQVKILTKQGKTVYAVVPDSKLGPIPGNIPRYNEEEIPEEEPTMIQPPLPRGREV